MSMKGAMVASNLNKDLFLSSLILAEKRDGWNHSVVNLNDLNSNIPEQHFKMEELFLLKEMLLPGDKMRKQTGRMHTLELPLQGNPGSISDSRGKAFYPSFFCLFFWLSLVLLTFTKLLKISISLLRKLNVRIIVYLDDMFLMASSLQDLLMA